MTTEMIGLSSRNGYVIGSRLLEVFDACLDVEKALLFLLLCYYYERY